MDWVVWLFFFKLSIPAVVSWCRWQGDPDNPTGGGSRY